MKEEWRDIDGYEDLYQVSNFGRVKSLDRLSWNGKVWWLKKGRILKPFAQKSGHLGVSLWKNERPKKARVHRLVGEAFIHNPKHLPQINHIDGKPSNNNVSNLEWITHYDNIKHAIKIGTMRSAKKQSSFKGVSFDSQSNSWKARIWKNKKTIHLGRFSDEMEAYHAIISFS